MKYFLFVCECIFIFFLKSIFVEETDLVAKVYVFLGNGTCTIFLYVRTVNRVYLY